MRSFALSLLLVCLFAALFACRPEPPAERVVEAELKAFRGQPVGSLLDKLGISFEDVAIIEEPPAVLGGVAFDVERSGIVLRCMVRVQSERQVMRAGTNLFWPEGLVRRTLVAGASVSDRRKNPWLPDLGTQKTLKAHRRRR